MYLEFFKFSKNFLETKKSISLIIIVLYMYNLHLRKYYNYKKNNTFYDQIIELLFIIV